MKATITSVLLVAVFTLSAQQKKSTTLPAYRSVYELQALQQLEPTIKDPVEQNEFFEHVYVVQQLHQLKTMESQDFELGVLQQLPTPVLYQFVRDFLVEYTDVDARKLSVKEINEKAESDSITRRERLAVLAQQFRSNDSTFEASLHAYIAPSSGMCNSMISDYKAPIYTIEGSCGTGASLHYNYVLIKSNSYKDLGDGVSKLNKAELAKLEKAIKAKFKTYAFLATRSGAIIEPHEDGTYSVTVMGYQKEEAMATGGSLEVMYKTKDFKTILPNSISVKKLAEIEY